MENWRDELSEAVKSKTEREAEDEARKKKRLAEALEVADEGLALALQGLQFSDELLQTKGQQASLQEQDGRHVLALSDLSVAVELSRDDAILKVSFNDARPREFDFCNDRHIAPRDVEEYVGRRIIELARAAQKAKPW
ncbi:MAG: hypothetical protein DRI90_19110 [Deltaproteobacteria bacterium]|nr:MAG: hypothetical protein DRI90_19110 [Deltaproteobacteria bacterium]